MHKYQAFQLNIHSELYFPELLERSALDLSAPDLTIQWGDVDSDGLKDALITRLFWQANEQMLWLHVPRVARFLI